MFLRQSYFIFYPASKFYIRGVTVSTSCDSVAGYVDLCYHVIVESVSIAIFCQASY